MWTQRVRGMINSSHARHGRGTRLRKVDDVNWRKQSGVGRSGCRFFAKRIPRVTASTGTRWPRKKHTLLL